MSLQNSMETPIDRYLRSYDGDSPRDGITRDVAFNRLSFDDGVIHNPDQGQIYVGLDGIEIRLVQDFSDEDLRRVCTYAINATRGIDPDNPPDIVDWEEMLRGGLQTALEDFRVAFAIHGMSRTGTHQMVRTRQAAFHQQSQRAHYYGNVPSVRMPESWVGKITRDNWELTEIFQELAEHAAAVYRIACDCGVSYQDARFALLEGTTNFILWEGSLREFMNTYAYRACSMFQWEIQYCFREMRALLVEAHPYLDSYIKISCEKTKGALDGSARQDLDGEQQEFANQTFAHHCTFQGWEEVDHQCDFPWARETNRAFRSEHHRIEQKGS